MNAISKSSPEYRPLPDEIPTLTDAIEDVPPSWVSALDAQAAEKQAFMALSAATAA
jgi:hypothetical protein